MLKQNNKLNIKIWESWATPNWSKGSVGQEESRSQILSPRSSIPNTGFQVTDPKPRILNPKSKFPDSIGWLSVRQMIAYHSILLLYKAKENKKPGYIYSKISHKFNKVTRIATSGGIKDLRRFESTLAQQSFLPRTVKVWNEQLPAEIRSETSMKLFQKKLRVWVKKDVKI